MVDAVQITAIAVSVVLLVFVLELVRRNRLTAEYSFIWIVCSVALIGLSLARRQLDQMALAFGIFYPPAALILVLILFVFLASVSFSVVVSQQRQQIEKLIEEAALMDAELRELKDKVSSATTGPPQHG
jgi:hypothetical protein